eukprot:scaffold2619_cov129-Skeletonema_dohrnii-CCMP3373.AAC.1
MGPTSCGLLRYLSGFGRTNARQRELDSANSSIGITIAVEPFQQIARNLSSLRSNWPVMILPNVEIRWSTTTTTG